MKRSNHELYDYHRWLISLVDNSSGELYMNYSHLLGAMDDLEYTPKHRLDANRTIDGIEMRDKYDGYFNSNGKGTDVSELLASKPCSILECLVALCTRYSENVAVDAGEKSIAPLLFYEILTNLGLLDASDDRYLSKNDENLLHILSVGFGGGSYFDVKNGKNMDIWSQCGKYVYDNFI